MTDVNYHSQSIHLPHDFTSQIGQSAFKGQVAVFALIRIARIRPVIVVIPGKGHRAHTEPIVIPEYARIIHNCMTALDSQQACRFALLPNPNDIFVSVRNDQALITLGGRADGVNHIQGALDFLTFEQCRTRPARKELNGYSRLDQAGDIYMVFFVALRNIVLEINHQHRCVAVGIYNHRISAKRFSPVQKFCVGQRILLRSDRDR